MEKFVYIWISGFNLGLLVRAVWASIFFLSPWLYIWVSLSLTVDPLLLCASVGAEPPINSTPTSHAENATVG